MSRLMSLFKSNRTADVLEQTRALLGADLGCPEALVTELGHLKVVCSCFMAQSSLESCGEIEDEDALKSAVQYFQSSQRKLYRPLRVLPAGQDIMLAASNALSRYEFDRAAKTSLPKLCKTLKGLAAVTKKLELSATATFRSRVLS